MTELKLYEEVVRLTRQGESFAIATVVAHSGSSPRKSGAKMLVRGDASSLGTVGGGRIEKEAIEASLASLADGEPRTLEFVLTEEHGYACGGCMSVFIDPQGLRPLLVMFGAGHVGQAVTELAGKCGFRVTVVDERAEYTSSQLLPGADRVICSPVIAAFDQLKLDKDSFIVIATPGHLYDFDAVRGSLSTEAGFIGLLGSRRKRAILQQTLEAEGFDAAQQERVITPVGLDIGAQTPEEIAVSIIAQLISIRRAK